MTEHEKESAYLLQRIDCNCNDCFFMKRDLKKYYEVQAIAKENELWLFENRRIRLREKAAEKRKKGEYEKAMLLEDQAGKMKFQYSASTIQYGDCEKFNMPVSFIPKTCQIETQKCFVHRKDVHATDSD